MPTQLHQILAIVAGKKSWAQSELTKLYHVAQKPELYEGLSRTYRPKDEEGDQLPPESKRLQRTVQQDLAEAARIQTELFDAVATQDWANCEARADVIVGNQLDGQVVLVNVPVTHLLFLEKQLTDVRTFVEKLPTLDASEDWSYPGAIDAYATEPRQTTRTKKVPKNWVKAEATKEHPAQVDVFTEDVIVGFWETVRHSGAIPAANKHDMLERVRKLQEAVKTAREAANCQEVTQQKVGGPIFDYLFGVQS